LTSTSRFTHSSGSIAATVSKPKGGSEAFLRMNFKACLKLQNVSGNSGYSSNTFIRPNDATKPRARHGVFTPYTK
jgi:hypothetical protein